MEKSGRLRKGVSKLSTLSLLLLAISQFSSPANAKVVFEQDFYQLNGVNVPVKQWQDTAQRPKAILVAVHGAARHAGTYQQLAEKLAADGYVSICPDLRGHGEWRKECNRDESTKIVDYKTSVDDVTMLIDAVHNKYTSVPIFCIGESAGAVVVAKAATKTPYLSGIVLSAIGTRPVFHDLRTVVKDLVEGLPHLDKQLDVRPFMAAYSSDDERVRSEMVYDPEGRIGLSGRELIRTGLWIRQAPGFAAKLPANIPVLMLQGENDQIVSARSARVVMKKLPSQQKVYRSFPCGHVLLTTAFIRPDVMNTLSMWLKDRTAEQQMAALHVTSTVSK